MFRPSCHDGYLGTQPSEDLQIQAVPSWELAHVEVIGVQPNDEFIRFVEPGRALVYHLDKISVSIA